MKVQELRDLLKTADWERLEKVFTESNKKFYEYGIGKKIKPRGSFHSKIAHLHTTSLGLNRILLPPNFN